MSVVHSTLRLTAGVLLGLVFLAGCNTGSGPDPDPDPGNNTAASMTVRINDYREGAGQGELASDTTLGEIAQAQAEYNADNNINTDTNGGGRTIAQQLQDEGYDFATVAYLFNNLSEAASFAEWSGSPAYSGIMRDPAYDDIGVGTAVGDNGTRRWVVILAAKDVPTNNTVQQMFDLLNDFRSDGGAAAFELEDNLMIAAQAQADYNASVQANEATIPGVGSLEQQVADTGYVYGTMMWTLANGAAEASVAGWTDTVSEEELMLDPRFVDIGIGVASGGTKQWWVVVYAERGTP